MRLKILIVGFGGGRVGAREKVLREMGLTIVRFRNEDVIKDLPAVVGRIRSLISI